MLRLGSSPARNRLLIGLGIAWTLTLGWWLAVMHFYNLGAMSPVYAWSDQVTTFSQALPLFGRPFDIPGFVYVPWAVIPLAPFNVFPVPVSALLQLGLYVTILFGIVLRMGGGTSTALLVFTSPIMFTVALELNIDWIVCLGLLVPPAWSGPFLLVKPQTALGYPLVFRRREFMRAAAVALMLLGFSFLVWGMWIPEWWQNVQESTMTRPGVNIAPSALLPRWLAYSVGMVLCWRGFRRKDPLGAVVGGVFFAPYITYYSLLLPFALLATRYPRAMLIVSIALWILLARIMLGLLGG